MKQRLLVSSIVMGLCTSLTIGNAFAQSTDDQNTEKNDKKAATLEKVTVTGSLIPQSQIETAQPITVITAEDINARGMNTVAEALQKSTMATGGVQGAQSSASFTQGANTVSLFGLSPSYTKYLIDGRPMANFPALYNGSDTFNNISGIPIDLVERIEILPGGQSSLYGSDAIAGVVNVILKKSVDGLIVDVRGGNYSQGGGDNYRVSLVDGFKALDDRLSVIWGVQKEDQQPIWAYDRDLTKQFNLHGSTVPIASRDFLVNGYTNFGGNNTHYGYLWPSDNGASCAAVTSLFGGTEGLQYRAGSSYGNYCGSFYTPGYRTLQNGHDALQAYTRATFDLNSNTQLYSSVMLSQTKTKYFVGSGYTWWGTQSDFGYFYDPRYDGLLNLQRAFAPEDFGKGGFNNAMNVQTEKDYVVDFGIKGTLGSSNWDYDVFVRRMQDTLHTNNWVRWAKPMDQYFISHVLGPQQGMDPYYSAYPVYTPNYAAFYSPIPAADMAAMTGHAITRAKTYDEMVRATVTNGSLFTLPGGDAGLAVVVEYDKNGWTYNPDPAFLNGSVWGQVDVAGEGTMKRSAITSELRLPVINMLTVTASARYDSFDSSGLVTPVSGNPYYSSGNSLSKPTWSLGLEFRPLDSLLFRGKYGTAFRAPSLSDLYQGTSGYYNYLTDYYQCYKHGYNPGDPTAIVNCPSRYSNVQYKGTVVGSPDLKPINAKVWNVGFVWSPVEKLSLTADYFAWKIKDEVTQQSGDAVAFEEYRCRTGLDDINSPLCQYTLSQVTRGPSGLITGVFTPKINVSQENVRAVVLSANYAFDLGAFGGFNLRGSYTQNLKHDYQQYAGDATIDLLTNPYWSQDPKNKADFSVGWQKDRFTTTLYFNWMGKTPNYAASVAGNYTATGTGKLSTYTTTNLSVTYNLLPGMDVSLLASNLFNKMPPFDATYNGRSGAPYNENNYDVYGRALYAQFHWDLSKLHSKD